MPLCAERRTRRLIREERGVRPAIHSEFRQGLCGIQEDKAALPAVPSSYPNRRPAIPASARRGEPWSRSRWRNVRSPGRRRPVGEPSDQRLIFRVELNSVSAGFVVVLCACAPGTECDGLDSKAFTVLITCSSRKVPLQVAKVVIDSRLPDGYEDGTILRLFQGGED